jgi:DNA-binding NtrC family response regulator
VPGARILLADDHPDVLEALRLLLKPEGYDVTSASTVSAAIAEVRGEAFDVALVDLNYARDTTSGKEGLELLQRLRAIDAELPVVAMTAWGTIEGAVVAIRAGARDYVQKPWDNRRLVATLRAHARTGPKRAGQDGGAPEIIGESVAINALLAAIARVGPSDATVLVTGEHGTGKELVARRLHASSRRSSGPFVALNAGAVADGIFESELFGHVKGAFTDARADRPGAFALAHRGTLFLDEVGNMPLAHQGKLLRVLETREVAPLGGAKAERVDVRVVAATNADLAREVKADRFREDLLYRLNTVELRLPPLRDRGGDVVLLATRFLEAARARHRRPDAAFSADAERALIGHGWPGNVRELQHVVERAVLLAPADRIEPSDLALGGRDGARAELDALTLEEAERVVIDRALERASGNVNEAARALGLSRSALYRRLQGRGPKGGG